MNRPFEDMVPRQRRSIRDIPIPAHRKPSIKSIPQAKAKPAKREEEKEKDLSYKNS